MPRPFFLYTGIAICLIVGNLFYVHVLLGPSRQVPQADIVVQPGMSIGVIAKRLQDAHLVRSARAFVVLGFLSGDAHRLRPGKYVFSSDQKASTILRLLTRGPDAKRIVIPEGSTLKEIEALLVAGGIIEPGALTSTSPDVFRDTYNFLARAETLEGYLFPDTYVFEAGASIEAVVEKFLDAFRAKALPVLATAQLDLQSTAFSDAIILASLLEKEVISFEDRRIVAGILRKRNAIRIPLQVDATILYAKCGMFKNCPPLTRADFSIVSDMNTYTRIGFPPHAISNPGIATLEASVEPQASPYLYYLSDPKTGKTHFSSTFDEHDGKRAKYLFL